MSSDKHPGVLIAGGGIGGLCTALMLSARDIPVTILETVREIRPLGVGMNIQPAAVGELMSLGLGDRMDEVGIRTAEHRYVDDRGATLWREARGLDGGYAHPQYSVHRGKLQSMLLATVRERLGDDVLSMDTRVERFLDRGDAVEVHATLRGSDEPTVFSGSVLVGADGVRSAVRAQLNPAEGEANVGGTAMWRGITDHPTYFDGRTMILANDEAGTRFIAYPIAPPDPATGLARTNWVCMLPAPGEPITARIGDNAAGRADEILPHLSGWDLSWLDVDGLVTGADEILRYSMVDRDPLDGWGVGRVTLLGDAAHPMFPVGANGASQAILDARCLADALVREPDAATALRAYEDERLPATSSVVLANRAMDQAERRFSTEPTDDRAASIAAVTDTYRAATGTATGS